MDEPIELAKMDLKDLSYPFLAIVALIVMVIFFRSLTTSPSTNSDSARYLLSTLIQSEAAIMALVVTLSLVAAQLSASSYSARIIEIFRRSPALWIIVLLYVGAMVQGLRALKLIEAVKDNTSSLENEILVSYYLGILAFLALIPYIWSILGLLNPSSMTEYISEKATKENILGCPRLGGKNDPIQPLMDIVNNALMRHDIGTVLDVLRKIESQMKYIFDSTDLKDSPEGTKVVMHVFHHLNAIEERMIDAKEDTTQVIFTMGNVGCEATKQKHSHSAKLIAENISSIRKKSIEQKDDLEALETTFDLGRIGDSAMQHHMDDIALEVLSILGDSVKDVAKQKLEDTMNETANAIGIIGKRASRMQLDTKKAIGYLEKISRIGPKSLSRNCEQAISEIRGWMHYYENEYEESILCFNKAIQFLNPQAHPSYAKDANNGIRSARNEIRKYNDAKNGLIPAPASFDVITN